MNSNMDELNVGVDSVVIGHVSGNIGDGSVMIASTDDRANVTLNQTMAVGRNAYAGLGSIAIGANASAGSNLVFALSEIGRIVEAGHDQSLKVSFNELCLELGRPEKNRNKISRLWAVVRASSVLNGAAGLLTKASEMIRLVTE